MSHAANLAQAAPCAIEYVSYADATGYGVAALGYVRLLVAAGHRVHWQPYLNDALWAGRAGRDDFPMEAERGRAAMLVRATTAGGNDVAELVAATAQPVDAAVRIVHTLPRFWPALGRRTAGMRHIGVTVWETDRLSASWLPQLATMDAIWVPCQHNMDVLRTAGPALPPAHLVPHVCRQTLTPLPPARQARFATWLGVRPGDTVFYSINAWDPRKQLAKLIDGFSRSFSADDPALLVLKTSAISLYDDPDCPIRSRNVPEMVAAITARVTAETGRAPARIALLAEDELADNVVDSLHVLGDCYVSLSRCEGFGLGSFDAAAHGTPVIAVGYGGPLDYLGTDWPGRIPHRMVPAQVVPGYGHFDASQSWPEPDIATAFALMRDFVADPSRPRAQARRRQQTIQRDFGAPAITGRMAAAMMT